MAGARNERVKLPRIVMSSIGAKRPPADQAVNPEVRKADAQLEKAKRRERLLLLFPAGALGLTIVLIVITRRRKK